MGTRDDMCGMDVARMAELGGFAEEITIIGCAYKQDGEVLYRVTDAPEEAYRFFAGAARQGLLPTLPQTYVRREIIPAGQRERMVDEAKLACARQMQQAFDARYWECIDALAALPGTDALAPLLEKQRQALEGRYAREPLDLFCVFLDEALLRHRLTPATYEHFAAWVAENEEKMADDWVVRERYARTFYGFASYREGTALNLRVDTAPFNLLEKQQALRLQGAKVTPLLSRTLQYKESAALPGLRRDFQTWLTATAEALALPFEAALAAGPQPAALFDEETLAALSAEARTTIDYYRALWGLR